MKGHRLYLIADFENLSPDTLNMADICCYGVRYGKCRATRRVLHVRDVREMTLAL